MGRGTPSHILLHYRMLACDAYAFRALTGQTVAEFDTLVAKTLPPYATVMNARAAAPECKHKPGTGHPFTLSLRDHLLMTIVWLRHHPTIKTLCDLFGVTHDTVYRTFDRAVPLLEALGLDAMRMPDPGPGKRPSFEVLQIRVPEFGVFVEVRRQQSEGDSRI